MPIGYSPYQSSPRRRFHLHLPSLSGGAKKWLMIIGGVFLGIFLIIYISLGDLRFFMNHYLRLTFFSKNYLVLLQNNYELRPGGGFITGYGNLDTFMGFPTNLTFHNSYDIDTDTYVTPPYPQEILLKNEWYQGYTFRDANWKPNFPDAAQELSAFYQKKFPGKDVDGIIVINFSFIENLVETLGGITINGQRFTKQNLFPTLEFNVNNIDRHNEQALQNRKNGLTDLAAVLIKQMKWHPFKAKQVILKALKTKDIYFWFKSEGMEQKIIDCDWGNAMVLPEKSDFLAVNIANLGSKKADRYLIKEIYHHINIAKEIPEVTTEVVIRFPGFTNTYADDYKGYVQVGIPALADIKKTPPESRTEKMGDVMWIGSQIQLPAESKTTLTYTYTLPRTLLNNDEYRLRLIKQSGDEKYYWVTVEGAPDNPIASNDFTVRENKALASGWLAEDRDLSLKVLKDVTPPYPIEQKFEALNVIQVYWDEPIDNSAGSDVFNYKITDLDQKAAGTKDQVKVVYAEVKNGSVSRLELEGVTEQPMERYQIEVKGIRDLAGNFITPNPKILTVVQRFDAATVTPKKEETPMASAPTATAESAPSSL